MNTPPTASLSPTLLVSDREENQAIHSPFSVPLSTITFSYLSDIILSSIYLHVIRSLIIHACIHKNLVSYSYIDAYIRTTTDTLLIHTLISKQSYMNSFILSSSFYFLLIFLHIPPTYIHYHNLASHYHLNTCISPIGRILWQQNLSPTPIDTKGFQTVLNLVENTCKDSFDLFFGLYFYNSYATAQLQKIREVLYRNIP